MDIRLRAKGLIIIILTIAVFVLSTIVITIIVIVSAVANVSKRIYLTSCGVFRIIGEGKDVPFPPIALDLC